MIDQMFPFIVKSRMEDDSRTLEMINLGPGTYSPQDSTLISASASKVNLKSNLCKDTSAYVDKSSKKVIELNSGAKITCFGSS